MRFTFFITLLLFFAAILAPAPALSADPQPTLKKGLNVAGWLANARRQPMFARDFAQIKKAGFDHIRLPVNPEFYDFNLEPYSIDKANFSEVDNAITLATSYDLPVVLDIHAGTKFMQKLENSAAAEQEFIRMWKEFTKRYKHYPTDKLVFELLNEPQYYWKEERYNALVAKVVEGIRATDTKRIIVVGAPNGSTIEGLNKLKIISDPNIIYAFHYYAPYIITHQGVHMMFEDKMLRYFSKLPYPSANATKTASYYAPKAPDPEKAQRELDDYKKERWNSSSIRKQIAQADAWAKKNNVRIICGEFGVLRNHIDSNSRYRWIADTRKALEAYNIGWQYWEYTDLMGIVKMVGATNTDPVDGSVRFNDPAKGSRQFENAAFRALGIAR